VPTSIPILGQSPTFPPLTAFNPVPVLKFQLNAGRGERPALWVVGSDLDFGATVAYSIGRVAQLENTALDLHRGKRGPIEQSTHLAVAARGAVTAVDAGTLVVPWTGAPPRRQVLGRRKRRRRETDFRDDLLRRIDT
jgi:hypothetical protein